MAASRLRAGSPDQIAAANDRVAISAIAIRYKDIPHAW
jgi:hypothetical protein